VRVFFDTSALVPLVLRESNSREAASVWRECTEAWAWDWMKVEAEAALTRRKADTRAWSAWRSLSGNFNLGTLNPDQFDALRAFNRSASLRASDAGHLFVFDKMLDALPDLQLLTFDTEMTAAANRMGMPVHPRCA